MVWTFFDWATVYADRSRANMAHARQSRPDYGLGFQVKVFQTFQVDPSLLESGREMIC